jgi:predicted TIM-barrel fold metal-dependent hydrolase
VTQHLDLDLDIDRIPPIVSLDDHVIEPAHVWERWLPAKHRDRGPRIEQRRYKSFDIVGMGDYAFEEDDDGALCDVWVYEDGIFPLKRHIACVGFDRKDILPLPITYDEMRPGCYEPAARVEDMLANGVSASTCFPTFPRYCGQRFAEAADKELALACVRAYNDWMVDEWCGDSDGHLIPLTIMPMWDVDLAIAEVRRNAARGVRVVCFSEIPYHLGLPSIHSGYWEPLFSVCEETGTVVSMHIGSASKMFTTSADAPGGVVQDITAFQCASGSLADWLASGVYVRHPELRVIHAEANIGWIPYFLQSADQTWGHQAWTYFDTILPEPPSSYFRRNVSVTFLDDPVGVRLIDDIGLENVLLETDYPHADGTWPDTRAVAARQLQNLTDEQIYKVVRGNALALLGLPDPLLEAPVSRT